MKGTVTGAGYGDSVNGNNLKTGNTAHKWHALWVTYSTHTHTAHSTRHTHGTVAVGATVIGSMYFMAPEQAEHNSLADTSSDMYPVGVMMLMAVASEGMTQVGAVVNMSELTANARRQVKQLKCNAAFAKFALACVKTNPSSRPTALNALDFLEKYGKEQEERPKNNMEACVKHYFMEAGLAAKRKQLHHLSSEEIYEGMQQLALLPPSLLQLLPFAGRGMEHIQEIGELHNLYNTHTHSKHRAYKLTIKHTLCMCVAGAAESAATSSAAANLKVYISVDVDDGDFISVTLAYVWMYNNSQHSVRTGGGQAWCSQWLSCGSQCSICWADAATTGSQ